MAFIKTAEFESHFKTWYRPLCLFALRYVERTEDAEDIVQQAFTDVWEKNTQGIMINNLKSYLYRTVHNRSITLIAASPVLTATDNLSEEVDMICEEDINTAERDARLWEAIDSLPPSRRRIFLLSKRDGLKYQQIADQLKISVKTVENQMGKALKSLRETAIKIYLFFFG